MIANITLVAFLLFETARIVTLTWQDEANPTGTTYSIYRSQGSCQSTQTFSSIATGIPVLTYDDQVLKPGQYCYYATAVYDSLESVPSITADAKVKPQSPNMLQIEVKQ